MSDCKSKKEVGCLSEGDCILYMDKEYIIVNKAHYYVTGKSKCNNIMNFGYNTIVQYLGKGNVGFEFFDYEPIDKAAISLGKWFEHRTWIVIKNNELHVCYNSYFSGTLAPHVWKGHTVKYMLCSNQVINLS